MKSTSQKFKDNIYAPSRTVKGRVTFDISDVTAAGDVTSITTTGEAQVSDKSQLIDKKRDMTYNLVTLETDRVKLDGSFSFPDQTIVNNGEVGYWSNNLSNADGTFTVHPIITFDFGTTHSSIGLTITFDTLNDEYAVDYTVTAYDAVGAVITSVDVVGNDEVRDVPMGLLASYKKVTVEIKKWSKGIRRARVMEVDFGVVRSYDNNSLVNMSLVEEMDMTTASIPSVEFMFTIDNSSREFNILNPTGFYKYLQQRQQVIPEIGLDIGNGIIEYVPLGNYLLWEWKSDEGSLTATFTARTNLDLMSNFEYENLSPVSQTLYQLAVNTFALCGITNYFIDTALQSITTNSLVEKMNCKDLIQMISIAGCANIFVTRDNVITLKCNTTMGSSVDSVTMDNMYREPQINLAKVVKQVVVTYFTDLDNSAEVAVNSSTATIGDTLRLETNTLINNTTRASAVANWLMTQCDYRAEYTVNWRGNPAIELNDVISFDNSYGSSMKAYSTRNEVNYDGGALSARMEAKGVPN